MIVKRKCWFCLFIKIWRIEAHLPYLYKQRRNKIRSKVVQQ